MGILDRFKNKAVAARKSEQQLYAIAAQEMADGIRNEALWLKALQQAGGSPEKQVGAYIKLRVQALRDDIHLYSQGSTETVKPNLPSSRQSSTKIVRYGRFDSDDFVQMIKDGVPLDILQQFVHRSFSGDITDAINRCDSADQYPLHAALNKDRFDVAEWLLAEGADVDTKNYWGKTAKDIAHSRGTDEALRLVLRFDSL